MTGLEQFGPVILVLALLLATLFFFKSRGLASFSGLKIGGMRERHREMECVERMPLTPQHSLHLVRVRNRMLVIGVAPSGCTLVQDFGPSDPGTGGRPC